MFFFGPANFIFDNPAEIFPTRCREKSICCPKKMEKCMFWKIFFSLKCSYGHVEGSFNKPAKKVDKRPKTSAQCPENDKNLLCFPKLFFFKKRFDRHWECSFDRPAKLYLLTYWNWSEKVHKKCKNFSNFFSSKCSNGEVESSLKAPLTFFRLPAELSPLDIQKNNKL